MRLRGLPPHQGPALRGQLRDDGRRRRRADASPAARLTPLAGVWHRCRPQPPEQTSQHFDGVSLARTEARKSSKSELRLRKTQKRRLRLKSSMPPDRCALEFLRLLLGKQI